MNPRLAMLLQTFLTSFDDSKKKLSAIVSKQNYK